MDEERIERALRQGPPNEPSYAPIAPELLTGALAGRPVVVDRLRGRRVTAPMPWWRQLVGSLSGVAAVLVVLVVIVGGLLIRGGYLEVAGPMASANALDRIRGSGSVRVAITTGPPQVEAAGSSYLGFDVDVAGELARSMGVQLALTFASPSSILDGSAETWDLALTSRALDPARSDLRASRPYYQWPIWVAVAEDAGFASVADLAGGSICVTAGTIGADWVASELSDSLTQPPSDADVVTRPDDIECIDVVRSGDADAAVTSALLETELGRLGVRQLGGPVLFEPRGVIVSGAPEADSLARAVDAAIADLASDGTLAELSRRAFAVDVTETGS